MLTYRFLRPIAFLLLVPSVATAQTASHCWRADELDAVRVHDFKIRLMTGALHCRDRVPSMLASYNDFIDSKRDYLVANQYVVRTRLVRGGGVAEGGESYSDYETSVGNRYANQSYSNAKCRMLGAFARWGADASEEDLPHVISGMAGSAEPRICPAPTFAAPRPRPAPVFAPAYGDPTARTAALIARVRSDASLPPPAPRARRIVAAPVDAAPEPINDGPPEVPVVAEAVPASVVAKPVRAVVAAKPAAVAKPAMSIDAAQALAEAAKSLAAAAAAMQAEGAAVD